MHAGCPNPCKHHFPDIPSEMQQPLVNIPSAIEHKCGLAFSGHKVSFHCLKIAAKHNDIILNQKLQSTHCFHINHEKVRALLEWLEEHDSRYLTSCKILSNGYWYPQVYHYTAFTVKTDWYAVFLFLTMVTWSLNPEPTLGILIVPFTKVLLSLLLWPSPPRLFEVQSVGTWTFVLVPFPKYVLVLTPDLLMRIKNPSKPSVEESSMGKDVPAFTLNAVEVLRMLPLILTLALPKDAKLPLNVVAWGDFNGLGSQEPTPVGNANAEVARQRAIKRRRYSMMSTCDLTPFWKYVRIWQLVKSQTGFCGSWVHFLVDFPRPILWRKSYSVKIASIGVALPSTQSLGT